MEQKEKGKNAKKRKFKQTKQLMQLASNEGWTQKEIGDSCRVSQSIVSKWNNGEAQATESQLQVLLEQFGHKLRRNSFKLYWAQPDSASPPKFFKVEGKVILAHSLTDARRERARLVRKIPLHRLVILHQGKNLFRMVTQRRIELNDPSRGSIELECAQEDAIWHSDVTERLDTQELIDKIESYAKSIEKSHKADALALPFLIRKALINHGHPVEGIEEYPTDW